MFGTILGAINLNFRANWTKVKVELTRFPDAKATSDVPVSPHSACCAHLVGIAHHAVASHAPDPARDVLVGSQGDRVVRMSLVSVPVMRG